MPAPRLLLAAAAATILVQSVIGQSVIGQSVISTPLTVRRDGTARSLQITGVILSFAVPLAGSLGPIEGQVTGLADPQNYIFCVYSISTASGAFLTDGPKPYADADSFAPIDETGRFSCEKLGGSGECFGG